MKDARLQAAIEKAVEPVIDKVRVDMMEFVEGLEELQHKIDDALPKED